MPSAPTFAYHPPARINGPARPGRALRALRWAGALSAAVLLTVPIVPLQHGDPASAAAGIPLREIAVGPQQPLGGALIPASLPLGAAQPFIARFKDAASAARAERCLTEAIYYEGAMEPEAGQRAIAQVVLNRVRHPAWPDSVCGVVFQGQERATGCQFTFTCDGARAHIPVASLWLRARAIAKEALAGAVAPEVGLATHYHADYVLPYWSASLAPEGRIGRHLFYRWRGGAGEAPAFTMPYAGREPLIPLWTPRAAVPLTPPGEVVIAAANAASPLPASFTPPRAAPLGLARHDLSAEAPGAETPAPAPVPAAAPAPFRARPLTLAAKPDGPA
jgi:spore germination cell wall hydrolase CwlJ-like protein